LAIARMCEALLIDMRKAPTVVIGLDSPQGSL
jgi:hypothetical protein